MTSSEIDPHQLAADLRGALGNLVRHLRTEESVLPQPQAGALGWLVREGPHTTAELAQRQKVRHQSMARTVSQLLAAGLVTQRPHPTDGRKLVLHATETGTATLHEQRTRREARLAAAIAEQLSPEEQRTLAEALALVRRITPPPAHL
ncbi:MarR family transcriptional regulator [Streptomyces tateyamensis]|uniref:MarR family transcriptional regulator n=1 Tax=Streptomyces tateyamensis TaxID=565073 RepID=A0A2V4PP78_9ACTN|nr:MarR family transcriptional regulator [Streptomyces tateyamensis]PYC88116.1 MarR family transcriptional regulator [Streptomyces tateyamensis]